MRFRHTSTEGADHRCSFHAWPGEKYGRLLREASRRIRTSCIFGANEMFIPPPLLPFQSPANAQWQADEQDSISGSSSSVFSSWWRILYLVLSAACLAITGVGLAALFTVSFFFTSLRCVSFSKLGWPARARWPIFCLWLVAAPVCRSCFFPGRRV